MTKRDEYLALFTRQLRALPPTDREFEIAQAWQKDHAAQRLTGLGHVLTVGTGMVGLGLGLSGGAPISLTFLGLLTVILAVAVRALDLRNRDQVQPAEAMMSTYKDARRLMDANERLTAIGKCGGDGWWRKRLTSYNQIARMLCWSYGLVGLAMIGYGVVTLIIG